MEEKWYRVLISYLGIALGVLIMAISLNFFLEPNTIAPGGVTGLAVVLKKTTGVPVYMTNLFINIPLFIIGVRILGKAFGLKTLFATLIFSLCLKFVPHDIVTQDLLLASVFGGVLMGIGLGIVFKSGGTTGGTDLAGSILNKFIPTLNVSTFMMIIDLCVVIIAGIVNRKVETSLYSIIALYISVKVIDLILEGLGYGKGLLIVTKEPEKISKAIIENLNRGATLFTGIGMYTKEEKDVLLCVVNRSQFTKAKDIISSVDKNAFVMVTDLYEVLGEGFKKVNS